MKVQTKPTVLKGSAIAMAITDTGHLKGQVNPKDIHRTGCTARVAASVLATNSDFINFSTFGVKKYRPPVAAVESQKPTL